MAKVKLLGKRGASVGTATVEGSPDTIEREGVEFKFIRPGVYANSTVLPTEDSTRSFDPPKKAWWQFWKGGKR